MSLIGLLLIDTAFLNATPTAQFCLCNPEVSTVSLTVVNQSRSDIMISKCGFYPNHSVRLIDSGGKAVELSEKGLRSTSAFGSGIRYKNVFVEIPKGGRHEYKTPPLLPLFKVTKPGTYTLEIHYLDKVGGAPEMKTGKVRIEVLG